MIGDGAAVAAGCGGGNIARAAGGGAVCTTTGVAAGVICLSGGGRCDDDADNNTFSLTGRRLSGIGVAGVAAGVAAAAAGFVGGGVAAADARALRLPRIVCNIPINLLRSSVNPRVATPSSSFNFFISTFISNNLIFDKSLSDGTPLGVAAGTTVGVGAPDFGVANVDGDAGDAAPAPAAPALDGVAGAALDGVAGAGPAAALAPGPGGGPAPPGAGGGGAPPAGTTTGVTIGVSCSPTVIKFAFSCPSLVIPVLRVNILHCSSTAALLLFRYILSVGIKKGTSTL